MKLVKWLSAAAISVAAVATPAVLGSAPAMAATCTQTSANGNCGPYSDPNVYTDVNGTDLVAQDVWNTPPNWITPNPCGSTASCQTLSSNGDNNWTVAANFNSADNGSVKSYPDTQVTYTLTNGTTPPMSNFGTTLNSSWSNIDPSGAGQDYEYAYDIWLNPAGNQSWGSPQDQEIMIWTDNHGQTPAGSDTGQHYTDAAGTSWEIWVDSGSSSTSSTNDIVSFVRSSNAQTGSVDLMGFFNFLKNNGYTNSNAGIDQLDYGVELCSTGGLKTYGLNSYTLTKNGGGGGGGTAPVVSTNAATGVDSADATLNGTVNPEGAATTYQFDYGTTTSYGSSVPVPAGSAGSGSAAVPESATLSGLQPSTTYHYRIEATNATGTTLGSDQSFTTAASGGGGGATVAFDAKAGGKKTGTAALAWSHTVGSGTNRVLLVESTVGVSNDVGCTQSVTDNGVTMTKLGVIHTNNQHAGFMDVWAMVNPPSGVNSLSMSDSGCTSPTLTAVSESFTGASQVIGNYSLLSAFGSGTSISKAITPASASDMVFAGSAAGNTLLAPSAPAANSLLENMNANTGAGNSAGATLPGSASSETFTQGLSTSDWWAAGLVDIPHA